MDGKQKTEPGFPGRWIKLVLGENVEVGVAYLAGQVFENDLYGYLLDFKIAEEYRRRGAGKKLMGAVKTAAKREGCKRIAVMMPQEKPFSLWLTHVGFSPLGEALVMELWGFLTKIPRFGRGISYSRKDYPRPRYTFAKADFISEAALGRDSTSHFSA